MNEVWLQVLPGLAINVPVGVVLLLQGRRHADQIDRLIDIHQKSVSELARDAQERLKAGASECHAVQERGTEAALKLAENAAGQRQALEGFASQLQQNTIVVARCGGSNGA